MHTGNTQHNMRAGDHDGARSILFQQALREDSNWETDWLWLAQQALSEHEQLYSLRRALYINPHSRQARHELARLQVGKRHSCGANSSHAELHVM
ncbi:MAG: hypothetical protein CYG59_04825 [Chloroflexi bacterium]|nr:MAG: hypothetical protein CYG59_04825 [Chloroflexota bacterium]